MIAARLSRADPAHKVDHEKNAKAFVNRLDALSRGFTSGPATCQRKDLITSHAAFGYLAQRFDLRQVAINAPVSRARAQCQRDRRSQHLCQGKQRDDALCTDADKPGARADRCP